MESDANLDATRSLTAAADAERRMAAALTTPAWYAPGYGACLALVVAAAAMLGAGRPVAAATTLVAHLVLLGVLVRTYQRTVGAMPRTVAPRSLLVALTLVVVTGLLLAYLSTARWDLPWLAVAVAPAAGLAGAVLSRRWDAAWAREHGRR